MPGVAQRRTTLSGVVYDRGAPVPDELVNARTVGLGLVAPSAAGDPEATKAELASAIERAETAEAKLAAASERVGAATARILSADAAPAPAVPAKPRPTRAPKRRTTDDTGGNAGGE